MAFFGTKWKQIPLKRGHQIIYSFRRTDIISLLKWEWMGGVPIKGR